MASLRDHSPTPTVSHLIATTSSSSSDSSSPSTHTPPSQSLLALSSVSSQVTLCEPQSAQSPLAAFKDECKDKTIKGEEGDTRRLSQDTIVLKKTSSAASEHMPELRQMPSLHQIDDTPGLPLPLPKREDGDDVGPPPDGGLTAWLCIMSAFFLLMCVFGFVTSMGQLQSYYASHQLSGYPKATVAWISTLQSTLTFFASVFFGRIFDAHGAKLLVRLGTTLSVASLVAVAFCSQYYQFLLAHALFGFSGSLLWTPAAAVSGHWFEKHRSTAIGIVGCGSGVGGIIYPILLERLLKKYAFRDAILVVAGMNAALMLPSWFLLRTRLPRRRPLPWSSLRKPWREAKYTCLVLGSGLCMLNMFSPYFDAPVLAASNHLPPTLASYSIAILQGGSFLGRATSGMLADRLGVWRVFTAMGLLTACVLFAFWTAPVNVPVTVAGMFLYGYTSGAWITLMSAVTVAISAPHEAGMRVGMLWTVVSLPILAGPVVCGVLVAADQGRFTLAGIFCGVSYIVGTGITVIPFIVEGVRWCVAARQERKRGGEKV